jgi:hypothetical protein
MSPEHSLSCTSRKDDGHLTVNQLGCQRRQAIEMTFRKAVFDGYVLAFYMAFFLQARVECCDLAAARSAHRTVPPVPRRDGGTAEPFWNTVKQHPSR